MGEELPNENSVPIKDNEGYQLCVNILFLFNKTFNLLSYIIFVIEF